MAKPMRERKAKHSSTAENVVWFEVPADDIDLQTEDSGAAHVLLRDLRRHGA